MSKESNIAAQEAFGEAVNSGNLEDLHEVITADSVDHDPAPGQVVGAAGYIGFFTEMRTAFPDLHVEVEQMVADDDNVAFAYTLTGTHGGVFQGHEPTGKAFKVRGMQISKFVGGSVAERWGSTDEAGMLSQLGLA